MSIAGLSKHGAGGTLTSLRSSPGDHNQNTTKLHWLPTSDVEHEGNLKCGHHLAKPGQNHTKSTQAKIILQVGPKMYSKLYGIKVKAVAYGNGIKAKA